MNETSKTQKSWYRRGTVRALVPLSVVAVIAGGAALAPTLASAAPGLPAISAQQLLAKAAGSKVDAFSGTVSMTTDLGIPQLPDLAGSANPFSLLSGSHLLQVSANGSQQQRIALMDQLSEYDFVHNGQQFWTYDSETNSVEYGKATPQAGQPKAPANLTPQQKQELAQVQARKQAELAKLKAEDKNLPLTPQAAAQQLLTALAPTTQVTVGTPRDVAGRSAYVLILTPKQQGSLVGQADIAVDAQNGAPLGVTLYPAGSATPFFDLSFTSVSFSAPPASRFDFTPPSGATVTPFGQSETKTKNPPAQTGGIQPDQLDPQVLGTGWLQVLELHNVNLGQLTKAAGAVGSSQESQSTQNSPSSDGGSAQLFSGGVDGYLNSLLGGGTQVSGKFGTGRVFTTSVVSVLMTNDGRVFLGAVTPQVLEAQASAQGSK